MRSFWIVALLSIAAVPPLQSQTRPEEYGPKRFELGSKIADVRTGCIGSTHCYLPSFGIGISGALNLTPHLAIDTDYLTTPQQSNGASNQSGGYASELLIGIRGEIRAKHYGYFIKAQPGYFRWSNTITGVTFPTPQFVAFQFGPNTRFVTDIGAGAEYSPGGRFHVRAEVTDLLTRYSNTSWTHNLQPTVGIYAGLGETLQWKPPAYDNRAVHPFWNQTNSALIVASSLGSLTDAVTTQRFIRSGLREGDPLARPLVKYGWSGQISLTSVEIGAEIVVMYSLHRMGQHWIERILPGGVALTHGVLAYNNILYTARIAALPSKP